MFKKSKFPVITAILFCQNEKFTYLMGFFIKRNALYKNNSRITIGLLFNQLIYVAYNGNGIRLKPYLKKSDFKELRFRSWKQSKHRKTEKQPLIDSINYKDWRLKRQEDDLAT